LLVALMMICFVDFRVTERKEKEEKTVVGLVWV
jgi:hypothetical protein